MGLKHVRMNLADTTTGRNITDTGGKVYVALAGSPAKETLYNKDGSSLANPVSLTNGLIEFYVDDTTTTVDLYGYGPKGHPFVQTGVAPSGCNEIFVNQQQRVSELVIPFSIDDTTAATETSTGFELPTNGMVLADGINVQVATVDATETIDAGILSTEAGGDADGLIDGLSVATAITAPAQDAVTVGGSETYLSSTTLGALVNDFLAGSDTATDTGIANHKPFVCDGTAKTVSYTLSAGSDTAEGYIRLPVVIPVA